jgi:hypothetical protein
MNEKSEIDESKFDYNFVPPHLDGRVKDFLNLPIGERLELTWELSLAAWKELGVVYDPDKPMDKTIRPITRQR